MGITIPCDGLESGVNGSAEAIPMGLGDCNHHGPRSQPLP